MDEEKTVEKTVTDTSQDDGLEESVEAFHESKVEAEGVTTAVEVEEVTTDREAEVAHLRITDGDREEWISLHSVSHRPRVEIAENLGLDNLGLADLEGQQVSLHLDRGDGVVRSEKDGPRIGTIRDDDPLLEGEVSEFDRMLNVERELESGRPPTGVVELDARGDGEYVYLEAELGGETVRWTYSVPDPEEFDRCQLTQLVDDLDVGGPEGLDGHPVTVAPVEQLERGTDSYTSDGGQMAILPPREIASEDEQQDATDSSPMTIMGMNGNLLLTVLWSVTTVSWFVQGVLGGSLWELMMAVMTGMLAASHAAMWRAEKKAGS